jgi:NADH-quinone oxidoreductase subunit G
MSYGLYTPEMNQHKVKKEKVQSLGDRVVLDQERCILCSRCVRFTSEVTKTNELGIFNRGDRSVLGTFEGRPMNNNYSVNTVDICPVGALTSKDFRFKQRVWFLKDFETVCNGCSTGCNVTVSYNQNGVFRVKPKVNHDVNGFWMCDKGRDVYKHTNKEYRLTQVVERSADLGGTPVRGKPVALALQEIGKKLASTVKAKGAGSVGVVLTGQHTNEEYESFSKFFKDAGVNQFFYWKNNEKGFEEFDGILLRGDHNPNTAGLKKSFEMKSWSDFEKASSTLEMLFVAGPEDLAAYPDLKDKVATFKKAKEVVWFSSCQNENLKDFKWLIPSKSFVEKNGTYINHKGQAQKINQGLTIVADAVSLTEAVGGMKESARMVS